MTSLTRLSLANRMIVGLATLAIIVFGVLGNSEPQAGAAAVDSGPNGDRHGQLSGRITANHRRRRVDAAGTRAHRRHRASRRSSRPPNGIATITVEMGVRPRPLTRWWPTSATRLTASNRRCRIRSRLTSLPARTDDIPVLLLAVASDAPLDEAGRRVENIAVPELSGIDGVRSVTVTGENTTQLLVTLRPSDLRQHDVTAQSGHSGCAGTGDHHSRRQQLRQEPRARRRGRNLRQHREAVSSDAGANSGRSSPAIRGRRRQGGLDRVDFDRSGRRPTGTQRCRSQRHRRRTRWRFRTPWPPRSPASNRSWATTPPSPRSSTKRH